MEPVRKDKSTSRIILALSVSITCVLCFSMGLLVPIAWQKYAGNEDIQKLQEVLSLLENRWYFSDGSSEMSQELVENAIAGMTDIETDPFTSYMPADSAKEYTQLLSGSSSGIGITYLESPDGYMMVDGVFINSPAEAAGMQKGDFIVKINEFETAGSDKSELVELIKNSAQQEMDFQIQRQEELLDLTVVPDTFTSSVELEMFDDYGLITLSSFTQTSGADFAEAAKRLADAGIDKLIIDLRDNGGGYVSAAQDIAGVLLQDDAVLMLEKTKDGSTKTIPVSKTYDTVDFSKIVVLQNENSASASEVLIGALRDQIPDKITTVGTTSYGKGTEQTSTVFTDGSSIKYTIAEWLTPEGISINGTGFTPDIEAEAGKSYGSAFAFEEGEVIEPDTVSVKAIPAQVYLMSLGYGADRQDGYFSAASSQALAAFQAEYGLEATGILDQTSMELLSKAYNQWILQTKTENDPQLLAAIDALSASQ